MGLPDFDALSSLVTADDNYRHTLATVFGEGHAIPSVVATALVAFLDTLKSGYSPFDRFLAGNEHALTASQRRGWHLFTGAAGCAECHTLDPSSLSRHTYHRAGIGDAELARQLPKLLGASRPGAGSGSSLSADLGRYVVTAEPKDLGAFRTPSLRNVAVTAPYFHDGSVATLEAAVAHELYYHSLPGRVNRGLTPAERADLTDFLRALTDDMFVTRQ